MHTWSQGSSSSRLDRFYVPTDYCAKVTACDVFEVSMTGVYVSDHRAVVLTLQLPNVSQCTKPWRLSHSLLSDPEVVAGI